MATKPSLVKVKRKIEDQPVFLWEGTDKRNKRIKGQIRGTDVNLVKAELRRQGINPLRVKKKGKGFSLGDTIKPKDIMIFTRQLSTMLKSGIAVVQALDMVAYGSNKPKMKDLILNIKAEVEGGSTFASSLAQHHVYFDDLYCSLVKAGEEAGVLEVLLERIATYLEKIEAIKSKLKRALVYPAIVLLVAFGVTAFIMIYVIPTFENLFKSFGADLPAFTKFVIGVSNGFRDYWWAIFGSIGGGIFAFISARRRSRAFNQWLDRTILRLPLFGHIAHLGATARFARTLATMFGGGVPLVDAMTSVAGATGNIVYEKAVLEMRDAVSIGQQLNFSMRQTGLFSEMVVQMVAIGEEAGSLSDMLAKVADFYEEELDAAVSVLATLLEPLVMIILAVIVGSLIVAMYLPIFKLAAAI